MTGKRKWMIKSRYIISILVIGTFSIFFGHNANSQVVISLLFGDKLNSEKVKFGLDGGLNYSDLITKSSDSTEDYRGFNLGFYFDIQLKKNSNWYLHTGLLLKSPMGADGLPTYSLNNPELDSTYKNGSIHRQLKYVNVPLLMRYKFNNHLFVEAGPMVGVMTKATDVFYETVNEDKDLSYKKNIYDDCNHFDVGGMAGVGYHLMKGNGMNLGMRYYAGFTNILKDGSLEAQKNNSLYLYVSIPIGAGEKAKAKNAEKALKKEEKKK
jgi:hypothetical protein